jgi:ribonuclease P protein component
MTLRWMPAEPGLLPPQRQQTEERSWCCGVVISSKVHKRAVQRNRLRRLLHQGMLTLLQQPVTTNTGALWLLFSLKPGSATLERERLLGECAHLLAKAGLIP